MPEKIVLENDDTFVYYVDIEKGVVAAVMEQPTCEAEGYIYKFYDLLREKGVRITGANDIFDKYLNAPIRAKAVCCESDEFNLEYGMELAKKRCLAKYYKRLTLLFIELNNIVDPLLNFIEDKIISCAGKYEKFNEFNELNK